MPLLTTTDKKILRVRVIETEPDPAVYCPFHGYLDPDDPDFPYVPNPINPDDGWFLIATFQNNSPNSTTFDPTIEASSGSYAWDLGDGTYLVGDKAVSHTYLTTATRTVKLYGKGTCSIVQVLFPSDNIVGTLDLSHDAFKSLSTIDLNTNASMTSVIFPTGLTGTVNSISIYSTGITGTLDLSEFNKFNSALLLLNSNSILILSHLSFPT